MMYFSEYMDKGIIDASDLKKFFEIDMLIKKDLIQLCPTSTDDISSESKMMYVEKLLKKLDSYEMIFNHIITHLLKLSKLNFNIGPNIDGFFKRIRDGINGSLKNGYNNINCRKIFEEFFSNMSDEFVEEVKSNIYGYGGNDIESVVDKSKSINELLHAIHSFVINNEIIFSAIPLIQQKENDYECKIVLRGYDTELSRRIFDEFPIDSIYSNIISGITEIIALDDKIIIMVRDRGHTLTLDIDTAQKDIILMNYFIPKAGSFYGNTQYDAMIESLPGFNKKNHSTNGTIGIVEFNKDTFPEELFKFISMVPTDNDFSFDRMGKLRDDYDDRSDTIRDTN